MLSPFDVHNLRDFNLFYVLVGILGSACGVMSWSGTQGDNAAARNAHEQKMGRILGVWRTGFSGLMVVILAVATLIGIVSIVWFSIGGTLDLLAMFRRLKEHPADVLDDGRVIGHANVDDATIQKPDEAK